MLETYFQDNIALGSKVTLLIVARTEQADYVTQIFADLWRTIFTFEKQFSRFLPNSELSQFNRKAGPKTQVTPEFRDLLSVASDMSSLTDGLFNPFILPALQRAGYTKSMVEAYKDDEHDDYSSLQVADPSGLKVGDNWATIPYGSAIDLGGCGKGYLGDLLNDQMKDKLVEGYWFSLGGDVVGSGHDAAGNPWSVEVEEADGVGTIAAIEASHKPFAVATSGTNARKGKKKGKSWHHILDPRTQEPTETDLSLVSIYSDSAVLADVLASCVIILGSKKGLEFLKKFKEVKSAFMIGESKSGKRTSYIYTPAGKLKANQFKEVIHA